MKDDSVYLQHILECIRRIEENTIKGKDAFFSKHTLQDATLRNLQTMTEATQRLSQELKATHLDIEWDRIAALRNVLVHDYLGIDIELVWEIVHRDLPGLKAAVVAMIGNRS